MRTLRLAQIAVEAEALHLRLQAQRTVVRCIIGSIAGVFLVAALVCAHVAVWSWLRIDQGWRPSAASAILAGVDVVIALALALLAARSAPSRAEEEAVMIRRQAVAGYRRLFTLSAAAAPLLRLGADIVRGR